MSKKQVQKINNIIEGATKAAKRTASSYVTVEHLLYALIDDEEVNAILHEFELDTNHLKDLLNEYLLTNRVEEEPRTPPSKTLVLERTFNRAFTQTIFAGRKSLEPRDLFVSIMSEKNTPAYTILKAFNISREHVIDKFKEIEQGQQEVQKAEKQEELLQQFCINLNEECQSSNELIGRDAELFDVSQTLARRKKNNVMLLGEAGVGKTAIVEGLAKLITEDNVPNILKNMTVWQLNMSALLAGTRYRGDFEERVQDLIGILKDRQDIILFIDEIHTIMGAGSAGGQSPDLANLIKPVLESGSLKIIGATTWDEYRSTVEKDTAINRRFNTVEIVEPDVTTAKDIVKGNINPYELHHHVVYNPEAVNAVVELAKDHVHAKQLPDSAFDVLDRAGARQKVLENKEHWEITKDDIKYEISKMSNIPVELLGKAKENNDYVDIEVNIGKKVFGQDEAITKLADSVYIAQSGLKELTKPIGNYLFTGPTGVGKTETCKTLAEALGMKLLRYDMSEYQERHSVSRLIGAPPGYMGYDEGGAGSGELINKLKETPNAVMLFDEVEKAHPDVLNILLQIMDNGIVTGSNGQTANARNAIVIMTSNLGAADAEKRMIGFGGGYNDTAQEEAVKKHFAPEFRNRLDAVIIFKKLDKKIIKHIAKRLLTELQHQVNAVQGVGFSWSKEAIDLLAKEGFSETMGARPMKRVINEQIKRPLARRVLFNKGEKLKVANLVTVENKLELEFE
mgnify:CR=1 FL=1